VFPCFIASRIGRAHQVIEIHLTQPSMSLNTHKGIDDTRAVGGRLDCWKNAGAFATCAVFTVIGYPQSVPPPQSDLDGRIPATNSYKG